MLGVLIMSRWIDGFSLGLLSVLIAARPRGVGWDVSTLLPDLPVSLELLLLLVI